MAANQTDREYVNVGDYSYQTRMRILYVVAIVALSFVVVGAVLALTIVHTGGAQEAAISVIVAFVGPTVVALLNLLKTEKVQQQTNGLSKRVEQVEQASGIPAGDTTTGG